MPPITQSDLGTENYGVANAQSTMQQLLDPSLEGTIQHRFMRGHTNVKPEIAWSQLRQCWSKGWEDLLDVGHLNGLYDSGDVKHRRVILTVDLWSLHIILISLTALFFTTFGSLFSKHGWTSTFSCTTTPRNAVIAIKSSHTVDQTISLRTLLIQTSTWLT